MRIVLANGIATDGDGNVDRFRAPLEAAGHEIEDVLFPVRHFWSARWPRTINRDAQQLYQATEQYDAVIAHSFGCLRTLVCAERRRFSHIFLFRPALAQDYDLSRIAGTPKIYCIHSMQDTAIRIGSWLPFHPFGRAGTHGMLDPAVINKTSSGGHNADFEPPQFEQWVKFVNEILLTDPSIA